MFRRTILVGLLALSALGVTAGSAAAKSTDVITRGDCTGAANWKLKLSPEDGRIEVEFEVDTNKNNRLWNVVIKQNGTKVWQGSRYTKAPSGSFEVRVLRPNRAGTDSFIARATNVRSGQVCRAVGTF